MSWRFGTIPTVCPKMRFLLWKKIIMLFVDSHRRRFGEIWRDFSSVFDQTSYPEMLEQTYYTFFKTSSGIWGTADRSIALLEKTIEKVIDCSAITENTWIRLFSKLKPANFSSELSPGKFTFGIMGISENWNFGTLKNVWRSLVFIQSKNPNYWLERPMASTS